jgi:imidazolonepropionase-like amidohydrolase
MRAAVALSLVALAADGSAASPPPLDPAPRTLLLRNATIWTAGRDGRLEGADLLVREGKIEKVGRGLKAPEGAFVLDATGKHITPGLVDCHSHIAIRGGVNEGSNNVTAEVRIQDVVDPTDVNIYRQLAGGVTAAHLLHGSANSIGGQDAIVKLHWKAPAERMLLPGAPPGIKFALGENPKRSNFRAPDAPPRYPATRMGVMESIRERFQAARDYLREWEEYRKRSKADQERAKPPRRDLQLEAIGEILRGERRIHSHAYRQDEMLALMRLAEQFGIRIATFQHALEAYKIADEIAAHGAGVSTFSDWWAYKLEAYDAIPYNGALLHDRGVLVSFNSDSAELARRLNLEAAKAIRYGGLSEQEALSLVTIGPARQLGVDGRIGSLEPGKDADFVVWSGPPLSVYSIVEQTWVDGRLEFDRQLDLAQREQREKEREELIRAIREPEKPHQEGSEQRRVPTAQAAPQPPTPKPAAAAPLEYRDRLAGAGPAVCIVHATVHTVSGETIADGTVCFERGRIVRVGAGGPARPGSSVVDGTGLHLYPGFLDAQTGVGLIEIGSVAGSVDLAEAGALNPHVNTAIAINPDSELIPVTRANGLTHVLSVPEGGLVSGSSALIRLDGWTWEDLVAASPVAMHIRWPRFRVLRSSYYGPPPSEEDQKKEREDSLKKIRKLFEDARAYRRAREAASRGSGRVEFDARLEAMLPVLDGRLPVVVHADEIRQIKSALDWAEHEGVRLILAGSGDLWRVGDLLRERGIPVIVESVLSLPDREDEPYDAAYTLPAKLHAAGVRFSIATAGGSFGSANTRNLPYHAAMAAAFGLPRDEALKAITLYPAEILGVGGELGSIEEGKSASLILTDGDPLEIRTRVRAAWIDGRPVALEENRHDRLYRKYRERPRPAAAAR